MSKKVVLVTGASSGIGNAIAKKLLTAEFRVFGTVRSLDSVVQVPNVEYIQMDVQDEHSVASAVQLVLEKAGRVDILINNAGISLVGPVEATSDAEAKALFDVNVFGVLRSIRAVLPSMRSNGSGLIVNISSVLGFLPAPFMGLYSSSKHALEGLSESLDHEIRTFGIRVVLIEPTFTKTKLDVNATRTKEIIGAYSTNLARSVKAVQQQVSRAPEPDEVAKKVLAIVNGSHRLREPADARAKLLSVLHRFAPASKVDKSLRQSFGLGN